MSHSVEREAPGAGTAEENGAGEAEGVAKGEGVVGAGAAGAAERVGEAVAEAGRGAVGVVVETENLQAPLYTHSWDPQQAL
jgi:hypothetical protein